MGAKENSGIRAFDDAIQGFDAAACFVLDEEAFFSARDCCPQATLIFPKYLGVSRGSGRQNLL
jgi:hypothetical protein